MTDIYIRRQQPSRRPIFIALFLVVGIVVALVVHRVRSRAPAESAAEEEVIVVEELVIDEGSAASPLPPREPVARAPGASNAGSGLLAEARRLRDDGNLLDARVKCLEILQQSSNAQVRAAAQSLSSEINIELAFSPHNMPEKTEYVVQSGDSLARLAKKFGTTIELIQKGNRITGSTIRIGDRLRILTGDFSVEISKSHNDLVVSLNGDFFKRYRVGTGEFGKTPEGSFAINDKIQQPTWWRPDGKAIPFGDPANLLGTHWLSLNIPGYGIHGTWEPDTIGKQASAGCIRLLNEDIAELYALLPMGTPVTISK